MKIASTRRFGNEPPRLDGGGSAGNRLRLIPKDHDLLPPIH